MNEEDSAENIEESQHPPKHSERVERTSVPFFDSVILTVEYHLMYEEAIRNSERKK